MSVGFNMPPNEMYQLITRQNDNWGIKGYQIPKKYFDHEESKKQKDLIEKLKKKVTKKSYIPSKITFSQNERNSRWTKKPITDSSTPTQ
jgi:hypothetical protein